MTRYLSDYTSHTHTDHQTQHMFVCVFVFGTY